MEDRFSCSAKKNEGIHQDQIHLVKHQSYSSVH
jgi:hypothetical protein